MATDPWGITDGYHDIGGAWHETGPATREAIRATMGETPAASRVRVLREGDSAALDGHAELMLEDGNVLAARDRLPADLPLGYHRLRGDGGETRLIVAPH